MARLHADENFDYRVVQERGKQGGGVYASVQGNRMKNSPKIIGAVQ